MIIQCVFWLFKPLDNYISIYMDIYMYLLLILAFKHLKIPWSCGLEYMYCTLRFRHYSSYSMLRTLLSILTLFHVWKMHVWKVCVVRFEVTLLIVKKSCCTLLKINRSFTKTSLLSIFSVSIIISMSQSLLIVRKCLFEIPVLRVIRIYICFFLFWKTFTHFTFFLFWF